MSTHRDTIQQHHPRSHDPPDYVATDTDGFRQLQPAEQATWIRQQAALDAYAKAGTFAKAAEESGIGWRTIYWWYERDYLGFRERATQAHERYADSLEDLAHDRVHNPGKGVGSDILLLGLLNANRPDKFRPKQIPQVDSGAQALADRLGEMQRAWRRLLAVAPGSQDATVPASLLQERLGRILPDARPPDAEDTQDTQDASDDKAP